MNARIKRKALVGSRWAAAEQVPQPRVTSQISARKIVLRGFGMVFREGLLLFTFRNDLGEVGNAGEFTHERLEQSKALRA